MKTIIVALTCLFNMNMASAQMSEGQIGGVIEAVNYAEIDIASLASVNTTRAEVMNFGAEVAADHQAANDKLYALFYDKGIAILSSPESDKVTSDADAAMTDLSAMKDKTFDDAFLDNQITMDQAVMSDIKGYMSQVTTPEFKQYLTDTEAVISKHLDTAKMLKGSASPTPTPMPSPSPMPSPTPMPTATPKP
jgi:putative membrane protein